MDLKEFDRAFGLAEVFYVAIPPKSTHSTSGTHFEQSGYIDTASADEDFSVVQFNWTKEDGPRSVTFNQQEIIDATWYGAEGRLKFADGCTIEFFYVSPVQDV